MPVIKNESILKEVYKVWFNYLLLIKPYEKYCEYRREKKRNPDQLFPRKSKVKFPVEIIIGYLNFGDIFVLTFDEWWKLKKSFFLSRPERKSIVNFLDIVKKEMEGLIEEFKESEGRPPSLEEFKDYFFLGLAQPYKWAVLKVSYRDQQTIGDLTLEFRRTLERLRPLPEAKNFQYLRWAWKRPTTTKRMEEIQRYLDVYKSRSLKRSSWPEIINQIMFYSEHAPFEHRHKIRMAQADYGKAKNILINVGKGIFPGSY